MTMRRGRGGPRGLILSGWVGFGMADEIKCCLIELGNEDDIESAPRASKQVAGNGAES